MYGSKYLELLVEELTKLPSIGQKSAQRMALHLLRAPKEDALRLAEAIRAVKERVGFCGVCGNFSEDDPCPLCTDPKRNDRVVCVVEQPVDVIAFERTGPVSWPLPRARWGAVTSRRHEPREPAHP